MGKFTVLLTRKEFRKKRAKKLLKRLLRRGGGVTLVLK